MASITAIEGIGPKYRKKLAAADIRTCEKLLEAGATRVAVSFAPTGPWQAEVPREAPFLFATRLTPAHTAPVKIPLVV